jgi:hypothetical protein
MCQGNTAVEQAGVADIMLNFNNSFVLSHMQPAAQAASGPPNTVLSRSLRELSLGTNLENTLGEVEGSLGRFYRSYLSRN